MSFPLLLTLADLDSSVQAVESQLARLYAALHVNEERLIQSFQTASQQAATLGDQIHAERPDARWSDRAALEQLIQDLKAAAEERLNQQRRARLLDLANELEAGRVKHRLESRTTLLNKLRSEAVDELRALAAVPQHTKELPGPGAHQWLFWAFDLQDEKDAAILAELHSSFPALEHFTGEMEEMYWIAPARSQGSQPPGPRPPDKPTATSSASVGVASGASSKSHNVGVRSTSDMQAAEPTEIFASSYNRPSTQPSAAIEKAIAAAPPPEEVLLRSETPAPAPIVEHSIAQPDEQRSDAGLEQPAEPLPTIVQAAEEKTSAESEKQAGIFGRLFSRKRSAMAWAGAGGFIVLSALFFAVIYYMHDRGGDKPGPTVEAATAAAAASPSVNGAPTPNGSAPDAPAAPGTDATSKTPLLHKQPAEGPQDSILLSLENCDRGKPEGIECWGYASNLGSAASRVSLDRVDVVDGRGNSFSLDRRGQFAFPTGQTSYIPAGSHVKFTLTVPDKDLEARTLTLYMDLSNPRSLEYTFRNIPVAQ